MNRLRIDPGIVLCLILVAPAASAQEVASAGYVPQRVYDTTRGAFSDFETMVAELARADVVFVGEQHDDPNTHRLEAAILHGLLRRGVRVMLSLEMFERDTQTLLNRYLAGSLSEEDFLKQSRPWPRYATDYRTLVELSKAHGWPVIAASVPRRLASEVARAGLATLAKLPAVDRAYAAVDLQCPRDQYFERFADTMADHHGRGRPKPSAEEQRVVVERYYESQCVKDETMAESIAAASPTSGDSRPATVVHVNGAFHTDFGDGVAARTRRRLSSRKVAIVSILPVADLDSLAPAGDDLKRADYLVYTIK